MGPIIVRYQGEYFWNWNYKIEDNGITLMKCNGEKIFIPNDNWAPESDAARKWGISLLDMKTTLW